MARAPASNPAVPEIPIVEHFLKRYWQVLLLDDDVLISPNAPDLFDMVRCDELGAVFEDHKPQTWHHMHWQSACEIYRLPNCKPKQWRIFNSGLMLFSQRHAQLLEGWPTTQLTCRIFCDQLFFNAMVKRAGVCVRHLGNAFNYVGSELRQALMTSGEMPSTGKQRHLRRLLRDACVVHLTRKVPKLYSADWVVQRSLRSLDVLLCAQNATWTISEAERQTLLDRLPSFEGKYDLEQQLCAGQAPGCKLQPWVKSA
eukprot:CAMPEP_0119312418 /NCGR_PEP_ID=MMETSP1333-20130426/26370_1 /TAXON_ID=418940 /ORGANISM="Scyphosphaera apsteinii, Strain RCC1455" /LENGTH=255 /DNA_ID=CAMNT_0007317039 /DNA_START=334 /DNA_END=1102 /DNA_ORIENTATION=+